MQTIWYNNVFLEIFKASIPFAFALLVLFMYKKWDERDRRNRLKILMKKEIQLNKKLLEEIQEKNIIAFPSRFSKIFEASIENLDVFEERVLEKILRFYFEIDRLEILYKSILKEIEKSKRKGKIEGFLSSIMASEGRKIEYKDKIEDLVELAEEILKEL